MVGELLTGGVSDLKEGMGCGRTCLPPNSLRSDQAEGLQRAPSQSLPHTVYHLYLRIRTQMPHLCSVLRKDPVAVWELLTQKHRKHQMLSHFVFELRSALLTHSGSTVMLRIEPYPVEC